MNQLTLAQLEIEPGDRILEVGFGGGDLLTRILITNKPKLVAGIDRSPEMFRRASRLLKNHIRDEKLDLRCADVESLPFPTSAFTKVCSVNTLYFWPSPARALDECRRVLQPQGRLLICFNSKQDMEAWPIHQHGFRLYELDEVKELLGNAGFEKFDVVSGQDAHQGLFYCISAM